jgi:septum formation protein
MRNEEWQYNGAVVTGDSAIRNPQSAIILASASPRRRELLAALGLPVTVAPADVDESVRAGESPVEAALRLALAKAQTVARRLVATTMTAVASSPLVLGADTIVALGGRIFGKPADAAEAAAMLRALRGRAHTVVTGVALVDPATGDACSAAPSTTVQMRRYSDAEIAASIRAGTPFDKAGAYAIQDEDFAPVARIDGCYCIVMGLPLWTVYHLVRDLRPALDPVPPSANRAICAGCPLR